MAEHIRTLPYELMAEQCADELIERLGDTIEVKSPFLFHGMIQEAIHDMLELGMEFSATEDTPQDVMTAYLAGIEVGKKEGHRD